jgi:uncharacterized protein YgiM (DUF1202 family)/endonuclease/exonuclease/phosphatase family metal-dependent hydrolase
MTRVFSIAFALLLILSLAACGAQTTEAPATVPPESPAATTGTSPGAAETTSPGATSEPSISPIPTTPPDVDPTPTPEPDPTATPRPSAAVVPAGIVKNSGVMIGDDVAFRTEPSTDSDIIARLKYGTYVQVIKTNVDAQWHQVKYDSKTGYVNRIYVSLDASIDGYQANYVATIVNCDSDVNVRSGPNTDAEVIGSAKKGSELTIIPQDTLTEGWYQVEFDGQTAYIYSKYLDIAAKVSDTQLSSLKVSGGTMYPSFTPDEYGYVVKATSSSVTITAKANDGVAVDVGESGSSKAAFDIPSAGMKTVRISVGGKIRYSVYISRNVLTVGTWNIKRGDGHLLNQGRLVYDQQPDIMGIQESFQNLKASDIIDNLASLKTRNMPYNVLSPTIKSGGGEFGNGLISKYKLQDVETFKLDSGSYEARLLQKAVVTIDGKKVSLYNTHFTYNTSSVRATQFKQVKKIMDKDPNKYKILTGDFNAGFSEFSLFNDGYTIINSKDTKYYDYSKNELDYNEIDNIIVSDNIKVINSRIVVTKFSDHCPVFAYLILN